MTAPRRLEQVIILVTGGVLAAGFALATLQAARFHLPGALSSFGFLQIVMLFVGLNTLCMRTWSEHCPEEGRLRLASRACAGLAAFLLVPWLLLGPLEAAPGRSLPAFAPALRFGFVGAIACIGMWLVMWRLAGRARGRP